jgi:hypothetical protein
MRKRGSYSNVFLLGLRFQRAGESVELLDFIRKIARAWYSSLMMITAGTTSMSEHACTMPPGRML